MCISSHAAVLSWGKGRIRRAELVNGRIRLRGARGFSALSAPTDVTWQGCEARAAKGKVSGPFPHLASQMVQAAAVQMKVQAQDHPSRRLLLCSSQDNGYEVSY